MLAFWHLPAHASMCQHLQHTPTHANVCSKTYEHMLHMRHRLHRLHMRLRATCSTCNILRIWSHMQHWRQMLTYPTYAGYVSNAQHVMSCDTMPCGLVYITCSTSQVKPDLYDKEREYVDKCALSSRHVDMPGPILSSAQLRKSGKCWNSP